VNREKAMEIFDLVIKNKMLPEKIEDLVPLSFIGQTAVSFYREKVALMDRLGLAEDQKRETLRDGQDAGRMLLTIEARIGQLLPDEEEARKTHGGKSSGHHRTLPDEFGDDAQHRKYRARQARTIARHPEAVAQVITEAEENEDIPTKTAVLNKVKADREKQLREKYQKETKSKKADSTARTTGEALKYLGKLREIVLLLPAKLPPEGWTDESFAEANAMVEIIRKRLEAWP